MYMYLIFTRILIIKVIVCLSAYLFTLLLRIFAETDKPIEIKF